MPPDPICAIVREPVDLETIQKNLGTMQKTIQKSIQKALEEREKKRWKEKR